MSGYDYWQRALAITQGKRPLAREEMSGLGISEDEIGCGFYRIRSQPRGAFSVPVAIWDQEGTITALIGDDVSLPADGTWLMACKFPVQEAAYRIRMETGTWPDEIKEETTT